MRHEPMQERSAQRVAHILDVASTLFSEVGYDNATTNEIAKRAGIPIGSVYQYFPNKDALLHSLTKSYLRKLLVYFDERLPANAEAMALMPWISLIIDILIEFRNSHKGFKQMLLGVHMNNELAVVSREMDKEFMGVLSQRIAKEHPNLSEDRRTIICYVVLGMIRSFFMSSSVFSDLQQEEYNALLEETKRAMEVYINSI